MKLVSAAPESFLPAAWSWQVGSAAAPPIAKLVSKSARARRLMVSSWHQFPGKIGAFAELSYFAFSRSQSRIENVRYGSEADVGPSLVQVRFGEVSGHWSVRRLQTKLQTNHPTYRYRATQSNSVGAEMPNRSARL